MVLFLTLETADKTSQRVTPPMLHIKVCLQVFGKSPAVYV